MSYLTAFKPKSPKSPIITWVFLNVCTLHHPTHLEYPYRYIKPIQHQVSLYYLCVHSHVVLYLSHYIFTSHLVIKCNRTVQQHVTSPRADLVLSAPQRVEYLLVVLVKWADSVLVVEGTVILTTRYSLTLQENIQYHLQTLSHKTSTNKTVQ